MVSRLLFASPERGYMMKRLALVLLTVILLVGCDDAPTESLPTPLPPAPTSEATDPGALPTATTAALATLSPSPTAEPPTDAPTAILLPTDTPSPAASPTLAEPTAEPTATETAAPTAGLLAPSQQDGGTLAAGAAQAFLVDGRRFQPLIFFVEPTNELDVALAAYVGDQTAQTTPEGVTPPVAADNALSGRPEILVLSPEADGLYTLVVRAVAGEGSFAARLYDLTTPAPGMAVQQPDTLAAGEEKTYTVTSRGARPVIAVADPSDQSDLALDILGMDGTMLTTANYSGEGGVETAYVLPLGTISYTVRVREANGGPAAYQIVVITVE